MTQFFLIAFAGIITGMTSGILGIGGGVLLVPICMYFFKVSIHQAIGTSLAIIVPTALCASAVHFYHGNVALKLVLQLFLFTIIGGFIGAHVAHLLPAVVLKRVFALFLVGLAIKMYFSS